MNQDQYMSLVRTIITAVGSGVAIYATQQQQALWGVISGAIIAAAPIAWSMYVHSDSGKIAAVSAMPEVKAITVTDQALVAPAKAADPTTTVTVAPKG